MFTLFHVAVQVQEPEALQPVEAPSALHYEHEISAGSDAIAAAGTAAAASGTATALADPPLQAQVVNEHRDVGRNDPCWCGSGKKFKRCHGA